ncbi:rRNA-processing protein UTP22 [Aspergillus homomorphus CBS 101889]|uniref:U3 small nucleolar RNA-associated protein 22 n=1 Tax=Aspergillus homomorphus (strain CBS 101889) TaxID=1450537 RepID=A0A395HKG0_ASPHC|nr:Nrap protein [Aspergillus homomorphus CBS 101889]RAL08421.1 Nrap protein [Aspergillus homomorphus CBS 101889]
MSSHSVKRRRLSPSTHTASPSAPFPENVDAPTLSSSPQSPHGKSSAKATRNTEQPTTSRNRQGTHDVTAEFALASGVYKSSFFKLQMDELLTGLRPNYDRQVARLQETLHQLKSIIEHIPERPSQSAWEAEKELRSAHGITVPFPEPRPGRDVKYSFTYVKPINVNVVGSLSLQTGAKSTDPLMVDLAVTMPSSIFQEKDYVNYRYFHKRAYYIATIAAGIKAADLDLNVKFALQDGDSLRPVIVLEPTASTKPGHLSTKLRIRVITAIEDSLFPVSRTLPSRNNIRQGAADTPTSEGATPVYNASLRSEAAVALYHKYLYSSIRKCESFKDACILGRTWLRQRGFGSSYQSGGLGGFEWTALMSLLLEGGGPNGKPVLLKSYSSYQLFKATLQFLAGRDLTSPLAMFATDLSFPGESPVLYDGKRGLNILYKMTPWSYALLRREADVTVKMLNESRDDNFEKVFILKANEPTLRFDRLIELPAPASGNSLQDLKKENKIYEVLVRALGDRAGLVHLRGCAPEPWQVDTKPNRRTGHQSLLVGLMLDAENATRVVDHGPAAEQKEEAASFRSFWGEKAELRRFKDGSIRESLVWSDLATAPSIIYQISTYILKRHFGYPDSGIKFVGDEFDRTLCNNGDGIILYSSPHFQTIHDAFNSLQRSVQEMDEVPLTVRHLAPASPLLRYAALRLQCEHDVLCGPVDIVLQFESSARWPDDLVAIQMTKIAFLVKIGDSLQSSGAASACKVGLENVSSKILNRAFLDITHSSNVLFRLRIHHDREQMLLARHMKDKGVPLPMKQELAYALSEYKRLFVQTPRLTQAIRTLCTRFPLLSPTIRLVKYWFSCHLLTEQIREETVELLVVRVFTLPYPWDTPSSIMTGFLRTLQLLARWDWQQEALVVDFGGLDKSTVEGLQTRFTAWRQIDPAMSTVTLFVASDIDPDGVTWTQYEKPSKVVAARMCTLAKAAMTLVRENGCDCDVTELFRTSLAPYDFIIRLRSKLLHDVSTSSTTFKIADRREKLQATGHTVVQSFIQDLQACYSPNILFFHSDENPGLVAGLWNPQILQPKGWTLKMAYSTSPSGLRDPKESDEVIINRPAILNEISRLSKVMIDSIELHGIDEDLV